MNGKQLKNSILQWAIQGKLVPQDPNDEPASVLLERIRAEKAKLVKEGKIKKDKNESIIFRGDDNSHYEKFLATGEVKCIEDEIPFEVPQGWEWCRIKHIADVARGGSPRPINEFLTDDESGINWIKIGDTEKDGKYIRSTKEKIKPDGLAKSRLVHRGDFLLTNSMSFGRPYITLVEGCIHDGWLVISPVADSCDQDYLFWLLSSGFMYQQFASKVAGAVVQNLNSEKVANSLIPLPPFSEQSRIISKIEEIQPFIERYGKSQESLDRLNIGISPRLKKSILQEAIQGRLVPQIVSEGSATELLTQIKTEKQKLVKEGKLKKSALTDSLIFRGDDNSHYEKFLATGEVKCIEDEIPFEIPNNWSWCRMGNIGDWGAGATPAKGNPAYYGGSILWLRTGELNNGVVSDTEIKITDKALKECSLRMNKVGDVLIAMYGATIGKVAIAGKMMTTNQACCACTPFGIYNYYLFFFLMASQIDFIKKGEGGAQPNISREKLISHLMPIPPLAEQYRIVEKIQTLLPLTEKYRLTCNFPCLSHRWVP